MFCCVQKKRNEKETDSIFNKEDKQTNKQAKKKKRKKEKKAVDDF